jgi:hypothetical protein
LEIQDRLADQLIESLRAGEVPEDGLEHLATGIDRHVDAIARELPRVADRRGRYRFIRGDFGSGKTFFLRFIGATARTAGFATAYVRVSYPEVPLHRPQAIYAALVQGLGTASQPRAAFRSILERWLFDVGERVADAKLGPGIPETDPRFAGAVGKEIREMLGPVADASPAFAQALDGYHRATLEGRHDIARGLLQWLSGDEHVSADVKRYAHLAGKVEAKDTLGMVRGLTELLRQTGLKGIVVLLDEVERLLRVQHPGSRLNGLTTIQNWVGALDQGELPGVLLLVAGTTTFFETPRGVPALEPLRQRIEIKFDPTGKFDDLDAVQIRLPSFDVERLVEVGKKVRGIYCGLRQASGLETRLGDDVLRSMAATIAGAFHGAVHLAPRQFLRSLVTELGKAHQYSDYEPKGGYRFESAGPGAPPLADAEKAALAGRLVRDAELVEDVKVDLDL